MSERSKAIEILDSINVQSDYDHPSDRYTISAEQMDAIRAALSQPAEAETEKRKSETRFTVGQCPWCLGGEINIVASSRGFAGQCDNCLCLGPIEGDEYSAAQSWNKVDSLAQLRTENERLRDTVQNVICDPGCVSLCESTMAQCQAVRGTPVEQEKYVVVYRSDVVRVEAENAQLRTELAELQDNATLTTMLQDAVAVGIAKAEDSPLRTLHGLLQEHERMKKELAELKAGREEKTHITVGDLIRRSTNERTVTE